MDRISSGRRMLAGMCLLASVVLLVAADHGAAARDELARRVERAVHARHLSPHQVDPARVTRMVRNELAVHPDLAARVDEVTDAYVEQASFDFAPRGAVSDPGALYRLPYDARIPRLCSLGVDGKPTHTGADRYAWDFVMLRGTPAAARARARYRRAAEERAGTRRTVAPLAGDVILPRSRREDGDR